jgi:sulfide:quinone oxidoreductase
VTGRVPAGLRVLVAGGGVAGLETMLALRALAEERVELHLLAPEPHFWYRPLAVAEPFGRGEARRFELPALASELGARFTLGTLAHVDPVARVARTGGGLELPYDALVLALGARPERAFDAGMTFRGPADSDALARVLERSDGKRLVFVIPGGPAWPLPAYELALMSADRLGSRASVTLVAPERRPLDVFGREASDAVARLLEQRQITFRGGVRAERAAGGELHAGPRTRIPFDELVSLPRLHGERIPGVPQDRDGFVETLLDGSLLSEVDMYAAGDMTAFPIKHGGIAAQQADAVAETIAARAGADVEPQPFRPVLQALLLTGGAPSYLRNVVTGGAGNTSTAAEDPLWWPSAKIFGRYLAPFLAQYAGEAAIRT